MTIPRLSVTEYTVLGLLAEGPRHGFALSKELDSDSEVGRVFVVRRPLVYRAIDRLVDAGYAEPRSTEKGEGPKRIVYQTTPDGLHRLEGWLTEPVEHIRDLRIEFLLKLALLQRSGRSPLGLIREQRSALDDKLRALEHQSATPPDHVGLWRRHNASAAASYLEELERMYP
ncbi:MAG: PadR family transcriptional regulator [Acidimicrobiia bacterium]